MLFFKMSSLHLPTFSTPTLSPSLLVIIGVGLYRCLPLHQAQARPSTYRPLCLHPRIRNVFLSLLPQAPPFFLFFYLSLLLKPPRTRHFRSSAHSLLPPSLKVRICVTNSFCALTYITKSRKSIKTCPLLGICDGPVSM